MRIVHIGSKGIPSTGGTERVVEAIAVRHARAQDVTVYGRADVCSTGTHRNVRVIAFRVPRNKFLGPIWLVLASTLHALFTQKASLAHVHGAENAFVLPLLKTRFPVVTTNHGPAYARAKWGRLASALIRSTERGSVVRADAATAVAERDALELSERYGVEVLSIPNGVDEDTRPDDAAAQKMLAELGLERGRFAMFAAARVDPTKGCLDLLGAWRILGCPMPLLVVGDLWHAPGHEAELREAADGMAVHFVPRIGDKALVFGLVAAADVFVFPSTVEAMSMMLLEATALSVPVLASDIPENTDVLPDREWFFTSGDASDLARAYAALKLEPDDAVRARCESRASYVRSRYSWDRIADEYQVVYDCVARA